MTLEDAVAMVNAGACTCCGGYSVCSSSTVAAARVDVVDAVVMAATSAPIA